MNKVVMDTNVIISLFERDYFPFFEKLKFAFEEKIQKGKIVITEDVYHELIEKNEKSDLSKFLKYLKATYKTNFVMKIK